MSTGIALADFGSVAAGCGAGEVALTHMSRPSWLSIRPLQGSRSEALTTNWLIRRQFASSSPACTRAPVQVWR